jgi:hypothetical protein
MLFFFLLYHAVQDLFKTPREFLTLKANRTIFFSHKNSLKCLFKTQLSESRKSKSVDSWINFRVLWTLRLHLTFCASVVYTYIIQRVSFTSFSEGSLIPKRERYGLYKKDIESASCHFPVWDQLLGIRNSEISLTCKLSWHLCLPCLPFMSSLLSGVLPFSYHNHLPSLSHWWQDTLLIGRIPSTTNNEEFSVPFSTLAVELSTQWSKVA